MTTPKARALYKKQDGILTLSSDHTVVTWTSAAGSGSPDVSLPIDNINNLQQTPDHVSKVMLKIFAKPDSQSVSVAHLFNFTSPTARAEANAIKDVLSTLITARVNDTGVASKASTPSQPVPNGASNGNGNAANGAAKGSGSTAMSFASTASSTGAKKTAARWFDDNQLRLDIVLQQSLMKKDNKLHQTYMEARATKPDSISDAAFNVQFWSSRTGLLRAHAIETSQQKAKYNVLPTIKPYTDFEGKLKLNVTPNDIQMICRQYPVVLKIYKEKVPKHMDEGAFWKGFFESNLARWLKGEEQNPSQNNPVFDSHITGDRQDAIHFDRKMVDPQLPRIIDVQGNDENQGGLKGGNRPDALMRPDSKRAAGARWLNAMSESLMSHAAPIDEDSPDAANAAQAYRELTLRDLHGDAPLDRIVLNIKEQARFFNQQKNAADDAKAYEKQEPKTVLNSYTSDLAVLGNGDSGVGIDLHGAIGVYESDSDEDDEAQVRPPHVGSRAARNSALQQIWKGISQKLAETQAQAEDETSPMGLPAEVAQKAFITNATTTEFLKQFWGAFLSGDPDRAQELAHHVEALKRSVERIEAVATEAEVLREKAIKQRKAEIVEHFQRTNKKIQFKNSDIKGGKIAVMALLGSTLGALKTAQDRYQEALAAEGIKASTEE